MKILYSILSEKHVISSTNTSSIIDVIEEMTLQAAPEIASVTLPKDSTLMLRYDSTFAVLCEAENDAEKVRHEGTFWIAGPGGQKLLEMPFAMEFKGRPRSRTMVTLQAFPFVGVGQYTLNVNVAGAYASWPVEMRVQETAVSIGDAFSITEKQR